jgi:hypothetical protein
LGSLAVLKITDMISPLHVNAEKKKVKPVVEDRESTIYTGELSSANAK